MVRSDTKQDRIKKLYMTDLPPRACSVYYYLFHKCYNKDSCFPSISTICKETKLSRSTVKRALEDLVKAGFICKERRYRENGANSSNVYHLGENKP